VRGPAALGLALLVLAGCATQRGPDPWEHANRRVFAFNEGFDRWVMDPLADAWNFLLPHPVETGIRNAMDNLAMPRIFLNHVLQGRPLDAGADVARFLLNSTFGYGGLFDVASDVGLPNDRADFGQTLGAWGVPPGPFLTFPILGPFSLRDLGGFGVDAASQPLSYLLPAAVAGTGITVVRVVNLRAYYDAEIDANRAEALDYYVFVRDAYLQLRRRKVREACPRRHPELQNDLYQDLYELDDDDDQP